jgi:hypothetical protein
MDCQRGRGDHEHWYTDGALVLGLAGRPVPDGIARSLMAFEGLKQQHPPVYLTAWDLQGVVEWSWVLVHLGLGRRVLLDADGRGVAP